MLIAATAFVDVACSFPEGSGVVRSAVVRPADTTKKHPLLLCFPDIFGNSEPHLRLMRRLAGHGFVVVSPEPWAHAYPPGTVFDFEADRQKALDAQDLADGAAADSARRAVVAHFAADTDGVFAIGFCYGGHLAFRAALDDVTAATVTCYGTGLHRAKLGNVDVDSLAEATAIKGELLLVWGRQDPHIPAEGRAIIHRTLDDAGVRFEARFFDAGHAFMRDVGERYDPAATDEVIAAALAVFRRGRGI